MAALDFPASPTLNQTYPAPAVPGVPVYTWDGEKWTTTGGAVGSTGAADDPPLMDGTASVGSSTQWAREDHRHPTDTAIATGDALKVAKAGDTMTGDLTISKINPTIGLSKTAAAQDISIAGRLNGVTRWILAPGNAAPESGSNAGSDFAVVRFSDAGAYLGQPLTISRVDGRITVEADPTAALGVATKQYVDGKVLPAATGAEYLANTAGRMLTPNAVWQAAQLGQLTDGATVTPDFNASLDSYWIIGATGRTLANPQNLRAGQKGIIYIIQNTGGQTITTWGSFYKFPGGVKPVLSTGGGMVDAISFAVHNASFIACTFSAGFA